VVKLMEVLRFCFQRCKPLILISLVIPHWKLWLHVTRRYVHFAVRTFLSKSCNLLTHLIAEFFCYFKNERKFSASSATAVEEQSKSYVAVMTEFCLKFNWMQLSHNSVLDITFILISVCWIYPCRD
jgi:hypothetical protein